MNGALLAAARRTSAPALLSLACAAAHAQGPPPAAPPVLTLTRRAAIELALARNPQLAARREQIAQARARRVEALAIPDPSLAALRDQSADYPATATTLTLGLSVPFPDKLRLRYAAARADLRTSEAEYAALEHQIATATAAAYDSFLVALRHRSDLLESRRLAQDFLARTQARFDAGAVPRLDVIKARVDLATAENLLIANQRDSLEAAAALDRLLGQPPGTGVRPADTLAVPGALPPLDSLVPIALARRPELAAIASQTDAARAARDLALEQWLPDLTAGAIRDNTRATSPQFFVGISMPLPLLFWQHTAGDLAEARHRVAELDATARDARAAVEQDVLATYAAATTALRQALYLRDQLLPSAQEAYRVASVSYELGGASALEVLDARRSLLEAQGAYADALAQANAARSDLERAVGASLPAGERY